jgi:hypothetical protein
MPIIFVHNNENEIHGWNQKKSVHILNDGVIIQERSKTSKIRSGGSKGVRYIRLITQEGCSLVEVLLYDENKFRRNN